MPIKNLAQQEVLSGALTLGWGRDLTLNVIRRPLMRSLRNLAMMLAFAKPNLFGACSRGDKKKVMHMGSVFSLPRPSYNGIALGSRPERLCLFFQP